jgi:hypothetical protein
MRLGRIVWPYAAFALLVLNAWGSAGIAQDNSSKEVSRSRGTTRNIFEIDEKDLAPLPAATQQATHPVATATQPVATATPALTQRKHPLPPREDCQRSQKALEEIFATELSDPSPTARRSLAERLIAQAAKADAGSADQFVLLFGGLNAAKEAKDLPLSLAAIEPLAANFQLDAQHLRTSAALSAAIKSDTPAHTLANCRAGLDIIDQLIIADDFPDASRLMRMLHSLPISADPALSDRVKRQTTRIDTLASERARLAPQIERLKSSPTDPSANLAVGRFWCYRVGVWERGLPLLALGSDAKLRELAKWDLSVGSDTQRKADIGDAWWEVANGESGLSEQEIRRHAAQWYESGLPGLKGLAKARIEKRLESVASHDPAASDPWVVLFRSRDASIWDSDTARGTNDFAHKLSAAPAETRWLRLTCIANGKSVIIPMTREALSRQSMISDDFGWEGRAAFGLDAYHLGIWSEKLTLDRRGMIAVGSEGHDRRGWGFGRRHQIDKGQGYAWGGEELNGPAVFEIAVRGGNLTEAEQKALLVH